MVHLWMCVPYPLMISIIADHISECPLDAVLPFDLSSYHTPAILLAHAISAVGVHQLLYVRRSDATFSLSARTLARGSSCQ